VARSFTLRRRLVARRTFGSDYANQVVSEDGRVLFSGLTHGRFLAKKAVFSDPDDGAAFTIGATRSLLPRTWLLSDTDGAEIARFRLRWIAPGAISVAHRGGSLSLTPPGGPVRDVLMGLVLMHGADVAVTRDGTPVGYLGRAGESRPARRLAGLLAALARRLSGAGGSIVDNEFEAARLTLFEAGSAIGPMLAAGMLLIKEYVIDDVRRPE